MFETGITTAASTLRSIVASTPGGGPPEDLPGPVPEFVSDLLGGIRSFVGDLLSGVLAGVAEITPESAATALDLVRGLLG